ncbi:MAG: hypothetical protein ACRD3E_18420 [Terriglobales bacterium]
MRTLYRWLLRLYPCAFRLEFGAEMELVFADAMAASEKAGRWPTATFLTREFGGLIGGAVRERLNTDLSEAMVRRFTMSRNRFRFSWAAIGFMTLTLAIVLYIIREGRTIAGAMAGKTYTFEGHTYTFYGTGHISFLQTFGFAFSVTVVLVLIVMAAMFALHRSGVHRLEEAKTWPVD